MRRAAMMLKTACRMALGAAVAVAAGAGVASEGLAASQATVATPWTDLTSARVRLVAGPAQARNGKTYLAGVEVALDDGWKTYWRNPGDAGVPPTFDWADSANTAAIKVLYPAPTRLVEPAAQTIGYKGTVIFPVEITPTDAGKPVDLHLAIELGICREICIPAEAKLSLTVPASGLTGASPLSAWRERVPRAPSVHRAGDPELKRVTATLDGSSPHLLIEAVFPGSSKSGDIFIEAPDGLYVPMTKRLPSETGANARFEVDLSRVDAKDFKGKVLTLTLVGDTGAATEATWTLP